MSLTRRSCCAHQDHGPAAARRHIRRGHEPSNEHHQPADDGPGVLPGSGPVGSGRAGPLGPVGRPVSGQGGRDLPEQARHPAQSSHGPADPGAASSPSRPGQDCGRRAQEATSRATEPSSSRPESSAQPRTTETARTASGERPPTPTNQVRWCTWPSAPVGRSARCHVSPSDASVRPTRSWQSGPSGPRTRPANGRDLYCDLRPPSLRQSTQLTMINGGRTCVRTGPDQRDHDLQLDYWLVCCDRKRSPRCRPWLITGLSPGLFGHVRLQMTRTFVACRPCAPRPTSNSTRWFSSRDL